MATDLKTHRDTHLLIYEKLGHQAAGAPGSAAPVDEPVGC